MMKVKNGNSKEHSGIEKAMILLEQQRFKFFPLANAVKQVEKALDHHLVVSLTKKSSGE